LNRVLAQHPQSVDRIELLHTHPFFELRSGHDSSSLCLSLQDLDIAKTISLQLFVPVIIRAILPNGYSFAAAFRNGKNISSKYFLKEN
jgi:hypothetical protein